MRAGAPGRWSPSAPCSLTEQMHLHEYVQRKFADATRKRRVHDRDNFAREYERPPPAASTPGVGAPYPHLAGAVCPSPHYRLARPLTGWTGRPSPTRARALRALVDAAPP